MKTTIEIPDPLFEAAKEAAAREGTTLKALVELGLRHVLENGRAVKPFKLRMASYKGSGLQDEARQLSWEQLRELSYRDKPHDCG